MSKFTRWFVCLVAGGFFLLALVAFAQGAIKAALAGMILGLMVAFIGGIGWFEARFPLPQLPAGERPTLLGGAKRYLEHYPGWPGRLAAIVILGLLALGLLVVISRALGW
jgi:hypothetical protein